MADAMDIHGNAFTNGSATLLARVVGNDGTLLTPAAVTSIHYTAYLLDDHDITSRAPVTGHTGLPLSTEDVLCNNLQNDATWTVDAEGYNFHYALDVTYFEAFPIAGRRVLVEFRLIPTVGQVIVVRFRINVI